VAGSSERKKKRRKQRQFLRLLLRLTTLDRERDSLTSKTEDIQHRRPEGTSGKLVRSPETKGRGSNTKAGSAMPAQGTMGHSAI